MFNLFNSCNKESLAFLLIIISDINLREQNQVLITLVIIIYDNLLGLDIMQHKNGFSFALS